MKKVFILLLFYSLTGIILAQGVMLELKVRDNVLGSADLNFGLDPAATDGIDIALGELGLPPFPPPPGFEARFLLPPDFNSIGSYKDIRPANFPFSGDIEYRLKYQGPGTSMTISWDFPPEVTGRLQDLILGSIIDVQMAGRDSFVVTNTALDQLKMTVSYNNVLSVVEQIDLNPAEFYLDQNYPNPFNPETVIEFGIPETSEVSLNVYDLLGEKVETLINRELSQGRYSVNFNASKLSSGIYFYVLKNRNGSVSKKMMLLK